MQAKFLCCILATVILTAIYPVHAQQPTKVFRIGYLSSTSSERQKSRKAAFQQGLRDLGYVEGKNIAIEYRYAGQKNERLSQLVAELVRLNVDVILAAGAPAAHAAKSGTKTIPIVMQSGDPVGTGLVASLARPGGNITGLSDFTVGVVTKRLELLKEVVPSVSRVAVLWNPTNPTNPVTLKETQTAAPALGVTLLSLEVKDADDIERAFAVSLWWGAYDSRKTDHRARGQQPAAGNSRNVGRCGCWRSDVVRDEFRRFISSRRCLRG